MKEKSGTVFGDPLEMIDDEKVRRVHAAAIGWLAARPELVGLEAIFEAAAVRGGRSSAFP